jgi:23S rRNA pseudouridine1911/1915/1917 synthase
MSEPVRVVVPAPLDGERIDRVVAMVTEVSRTDAAALVRDGAVSVDGRVVSRGADRLTEGAELSIELSAEAVAPGPAADAAVEVPVVHVDDHVVVIDKPADLVVHPGAGHLDDTLVNGLLARFPEIASVGQADRPGIVHRLDRGTTGLLVVARSQVAYEDLVAQLGARTVDRRYRTLVWGQPEANRGVIDAPIGRSPRSPTKMAVVETGKAARTRYEVEQRFTEPVPVSLLTCVLETGRTHQIRVHLSAIGHAVVGDERYRGVRQSVPCARPFLHAEHLAFTHPATGERLTFDSPLPADLEAVLATLS